MAQTTVERLRELTSLLNQYRDEYYNKNAPTVSDEIYDRLFDELVSLEEETGIFMANSPSQTVGYPAVSSLEKTEHFCYNIHPCTGSAGLSVPSAFLLSSVEQGWFLEI